MSFYTVATPRLSGVKRALPPPAFIEFVSAANAASKQGLSHNDCVKAGWTEVHKRWEKPSGKIHWSRKKEFKRVKPVQRTANIIKVEDELRVVFGWASVITEADLPVVDSQGDVIKADVLLKSTTEFMEDARLAKSMHEGGGIGEVLHSFPLTADISKALGINLNGREGWIVGVKVHDDEIWKQVKDGTLAAFSIGGTAAREEIEL